jgi:hypothetical protein
VIAPFRVPRFPADEPTKRARNCNRLPVRLNFGSSNSHPAQWTRRPPEMHRVFRELPAVPCFVSVCAQGGGRWYASIRSELRRGRISAIVRIRGAGSSGRLTTRLRRPERAIAAAAGPLPRRTRAHCPDRGRASPLHSRRGPQRRTAPFGTASALSRGHAPRGGASFPDPGKSTVPLSAPLRRGPRDMGRGPRGI